MLKYNYRYRQYPATFGVVAPTEEAAPDPLLHVFLLLDGSVPVVRTFTDDKDGLEAVSTLIRAEDVLAVVRGDIVNFEVNTVTTLKLPNQEFTHAVRVKARSEET